MTRQYEDFIILVRIICKPHGKVAGVAFEGEDGLSVATGEKTHPSEAPPEVVPAGRAWGYSITVVDSDIDEDAARAVLADAIATDPFLVDHAAEIAAAPVRHAHEIVVTGCRSCRRITIPESRLEELRDKAARAAKAKDGPVPDTLIVDPAEK